MPSSEQAEGSRSLRNGRIAVGALGLLCSIVYLFEGRNLRFGTMDEPGPGVFPLIVGLLFSLVSLAVVVQAWRMDDDEGTNFPKGAERRRLIVVFLAFLAYVGLLTVLGFILSTALFVAFYCRTVGRVSWVASIGAGVGVSVSVWLVFGFLLEVRLPMGMWN